MSPLTIPFLAPTPSALIAYVFSAEERGCCLTAKRAFSAGIQAFGLNALFFAAVAFEVEAVEFSQPIFKGRRY